MHSRDFAQCARGARVARVCTTVLTLLLHVSCAFLPISLAFLAFIGTFLWCLIFLHFSVLGHVLICRVRMYVTLCAVRAKRGRCMHKFCGAHSKDRCFVRHHTKFGDDVYIFVSFMALFRTSLSHCVRAAPPGITIASSNCARQLGLWWYSVWRSLALWCSIWNRNTRIGVGSYCVVCILMLVQFDYLFVPLYLYLFVWSFVPYLLYDCTAKLHIVPCT